MDPDLDPDPHPTPTALLTRTRQVHAIRAAADAQLIQLAATWADAHPDPDQHPARPPAATTRSPAPLGPDWVPTTPDPKVTPTTADHDPLVPAMDWAAGAAFAAAIGMSTHAGEGLIRDALTLRHRLPKVWARVIALEVPVWRARRIAQAIHTRPADVADYLDAHVAAVAERVGVVTLDRLIDEAMLRTHAEERELEQLEALDATHVTIHETSIGHTGIAEATLRADWKDLDDFDTTLTDVAHRLEPTHAGEPFQARRARALGVLADPARAAALLAGTTPGSPDYPRPGARIHLVVHTTHDTLTPTNPGATTSSPASRPAPAAPAAPSSPNKSPPGAANPANTSPSPPSSTSPTPSPSTATRSATGSAPA